MIISISFRNNKLKIVKGRNKLQISPVPLDEDNCVDINTLIDALEEEGFNKKEIKNCMSEIIDSLINSKKYKLIKIK